ncbi:protein phosphatase 2C domain-containing protein [Streptomyces sp. NBC_00239]|uniref:protein phosphatase 2C domain-containing protein n=1 Tax=Streptomyces sp. NBC_00239 TaxID=2903640 RepID=UPI002E2900FE|nr:protein phosphatase 2C domain-containing protein [Streptomyces sp. NBC_00239]
MIVAGAAVQGSGHLAAGRGCQDAFKAVDLGGAVVLAVADGVGSRDRSALGAHLAVDTACRLLAVDLPDAAAGPAAWTEWISTRGSAVVDTWRRSVRAVLLAGGSAGDAAGRSEGEASGGSGGCASGWSGERTSGGAGGSGGRGRGVGGHEGAGPDENDLDHGELAAGVAAAVVRPPWAAFLSIGDCFGVALTRAPGAAAPPERCHLVLPPSMPGDPAPAYLNSPTAPLRLRTFTLWDAELSGVVLATDGCAAVALDHPRARGLPAAAGPLPSGRFFRGLADALRGNDGDATPLRDLLAGPAAARTGDDLTVVCALLETGRGARGWGGV